jgi:epoxyqueuosine reductase QueG
MNDTSIEDQIKKLAIDEGADLVGICSADNIKEKEFSDAYFLLPGAKSVISIAIGFDDDIVNKYLSKVEYLPLCHEEGYITKNLLRIGDAIKQFLEEKGLQAYRCKINFNYRNINTRSKSVVPALRNLIDLINKDNDSSVELTDKEQKTLKMLKKVILPGFGKSPMNLVPNFSHRCAAVAAGLGRVGWSGNVITEKYGARVLFGSILTDAELKPDGPLENNPCIGCKICEKSCQGGLFQRENQEIINIGNTEEKIAKRNSYAYCIAVCSGMVGQNKFKDWSTWSSFRFDDIDHLPLDETVDKYVSNMYVRAIEKGGKEAENVLRLIENTFLGRENKPAEDFRPTCGFCQLVCGPTIKAKKKSYNLIVKSGCTE